MRLQFHAARMPPKPFLRQMKMTEAYIICPTHKGFGRFQNSTRFSSQFLPIDVVAKLVTSMQAWQLSRDNN